MRELLTKQRDLYRYINDETLRMANHGMTMREIAEQLELPHSLATFWANRGYYGSLYHDVAATYVLYLGWFDGNPATLHELPPVEASKRYVEFMGGADAVLQKAQGVLRQGRLSLGGRGREPRRVRRPEQPGGQGSAGRRAGAARLPGRIGTLAQLLPHRRPGAAQGRRAAADAEHGEPRHRARDDAGPVLRLSGRPPERRRRPATRAAKLNFDFGNSAEPTWSSWRTAS